MRILRILITLTFGAIVASTGLAVRAGDTPVLAVLEYSGGLLPKRAEILARPGVFKSPLAELPRAVWTLREGDILRQENSPPARFIRFVRLSDNSPVVLCNIVIRYSRVQKGWRPAYLLLQQSPVIFDGEKVVPRPGTGTREPVQIVATAEPTADGYFHSLSFGLASGPVQITAWEVQ